MSYSFINPTQLSNVKATRNANANGKTRTNTPASNVSDTTTATATGAYSPKLVTICLPQTAYSEEVDSCLDTHEHEYFFEEDSNWCCRGDVVNGCLLSDDRTSYIPLRMFDSIESALPEAHVLITDAYESHIASLPEGRGMSFLDFERLCFVHNVEMEDAYFMLPRNVDEDLPVFQLTGPTVPYLIQDVSCPTMLVCDAGYAEHCREQSNDDNHDDNDSRSSRRIPMPHNTVFSASSVAFARSVNIEQVRALLMK